MSEFIQMVHGIAFAEGSWATNLRVENIADPDCIILLNISRQGTHALDTYAGSVYGFAADIHYWSEEESTLGKPQVLTQRIYLLAYK